MASVSGLNTSNTDNLDRSLFPLKNITDVVKFFRLQLENNTEPDLTLLSIIAGFIEHALTSGKIPPENGSTSLSNNPQQQNSDILNNFPVVTFDVVDNLYKKFQTILSVIEKPKSVKNANRQVIKRVSDIIWHSLIRSSYKDRAHLQNLYSYLSGSKLDCFGVAFAVVAGCQLLGYKDVHLAISEDHAWVVFGKNRSETIEVTWHGKGHEDKRGQDVIPGYESRSWLYLAGCPVVCDRYMEVAAIVSAINISLTPTSDCLELADLQQNLLWLLYDMGHLQKYPMGLGNLGELEEVAHTDGRPSCEELYKEAIKSAQEHYKNHHVYPYTYQGNYYYRHNKYREAFVSWANAGDVIRLYNYSRDDEEIYKEFLDIANELIPHVMKTESSGHSARSILRDSECFANLLRFYDGICQWEEGSSTPILHIGWAKPLVNTISKFDYDIRSQVVINVPEDDDENMKEKRNDNHTNDIKKQKENENIQSKDNNQVEEMQIDEGNNNCIKKDELKSLNKKSDIPTLADLTAACGEKILNPDFLLQGGGQPFAEQKTKQLNDELTTLTEKESLNSSLSVFSPSKTNDEDDNETELNDKKFDIKSENKIKINLNNTSTITTNNSNANDKFLNASSTMKIYSGKESATSTPVLQTKTSIITTTTPLNDDDDEYFFKIKRPIITLYSQKMKGLKDLLLAEKLNTHAISLQVTAQSQVTSGRKLRGSNSSNPSSGGNTSSGTGLGGSGNDKSSSSSSSNNVNNEVEVHTRPKRTRRE